MPTLSEAIAEIESLEIRRLALEAQCDSVAQEQRRLSRAVFDVVAVAPDNGGHKRFAMNGIIYVASPTSVARDSSTEQVSGDVAIGGAA